MAKPAITNLPYKPFGPNHGDDRQETGYDADENMGTVVVHQPTDYCD